MSPLTESQIRNSFVNASLRERKGMSLPDLTKISDGPLGWAELDYLGWRDTKLAGVGYVIVELDGSAVGVMLRRAEARSRSRAQCSWCEDVTLPNDVMFFGAKRAGQAGRNGNTLGTLVCDEFQCSVNVRRRAPIAYVGFDVDAARVQRIATLRTNVASFVGSVARES